MRGGLSCILILVLAVHSGCGPRSAKTVLRLAVTTSTYDTGIVEELSRAFEQQHEVRIDVISTGTGKALALGREQDVDLVLVHSREDEDAFMAAGHGTRREDVMYNSFYLLGPANDPAKVKDLPVDQALGKIAAGEFAFVSRGDKSGTHRRELDLWKLAGVVPSWNGYKETGLGQGRTLIVANEKQAYVLSDSGTYMAFARKIKLQPVVAKGKPLRNPYGVLIVKRNGRSAHQEALCGEFVDFLISEPGQLLINRFRKNDKQLFVPLHLTPRSAAVKK